MATVSDATNNLEIAGLWPVSEAARKLWRELMLAVHDDVCGCTGGNLMGVTDPCENRKRIEELGGNDGQG